MTWTRLSDDHFDREESLMLTRDARLLHVEALVWCNRAGTDGRVPNGALRKLTDLEDPHPFIRELIRAKLWSLTDTGWQIDWEKAEQELASDVEVRKNRTKERQRRHRLHVNGDHSMCTPRYCAHAGDEESDSTRDVTRDRKSDETPSRPLPSRPGPKEPGRGRDTGKRRAPAELCLHNVPGGMRVTGDGDNASRHCGKCEVAHPVQRAAS